MDIHKPRPVHSWRDFAKEVGIIVLGVLIALGAEQFAEAIRWRYQVEQSRQAMRLELSGDNELQAYARASVTGCLDVQLKGMQRAIDSHASPAAMIALARAYLPPERNWETDAFQSMMASGVSNHMAADELARWSAIYSPMPSIRTTTTEETDLIDSLRWGLPRERPMTDDERDREMRTVQALRKKNSKLDFLARYLLYLSPPVGATPTIAARNDILVDARQVYGACVSEPSMKAPPAIDSQFDIARAPYAD
jgi:hypothetical protein